jgi:threonine dehydrogenase-like Zn-dependent dehydrogenase
MRAIRADQGRLSLDRSTPFPTPGAGEVLVRPLRLGVATPDAAVASGRTEFKGVLGHECVGVVEAAGPPAPGARSDGSAWIGKRVVVAPQVPCGACEMCKSGLAAHCPQRTVMGLHGRDGCFADVFAARATNLHEAPRGVDDDSAAWASIVGGALHACRFVRIENRPYVTILGDGPVGLLAAQILSKRNTSVRVLGKRPERFTLCEKWGIKHRHVSEAGLRQDQDIVLDCTGSSQGTETALKLVRPRGTIVVKGWPLPAHAFPGGVARVGLGPAIANEITIVGAGAGEVGEGLRAIESGEVDVAGLTTRRFRLEDAHKAFECVTQGLAVKALLDP